MDGRVIAQQVVVDGSHAGDRLGSNPDALPLLVGFDETPEVNDAVRNSYIQPAYMSPGLVLQRI